jgi:ABC-2 type transport system permease protein
MLSVINDNSITPIVASMSVIILFTIIGTFDIPMFDRIKPFLFTTHTIVWRNLFDAPPDWPMIMRSVLFLFLHIIAFMGFSIRFFNKKDYLA